MVKTGCSFHFNAPSGFQDITVPFLTPHTLYQPQFMQMVKKDKGSEKRKLKMPVTVADERESELNGMTLQGQVI